MVFDFFPKVRLLVELMTVERLACLCRDNEHGFLKDGIPLIICFGQGFGAVLVLKKLGICVWDLRRNVFEIAVSQRVDFRLLKGISVVPVD
jgi:hypothetical protein